VLAGALVLVAGALVEGLLVEVEEGALVVGAFVGAEGVVTEIQAQGSVGCSIPSSYQCL